jgi:hypothetical protein
MYVTSRASCSPASRAARQRNHERDHELCCHSDDRHEDHRAADVGRRRARDRCARCTHTRTLVILAPPPPKGDHHLAVGGGGDGRFIVYTTDDNLSF